MDERLDDDSFRLDEAFVRAARYKEPGAAERVSRAQRIVRDHAAGAKWRPAEVPRGWKPCRRSGSHWTTAAVALIVALASVGWQTGLLARPSARQAAGPLILNGSPDGNVFGSLRLGAGLPPRPKDAANHPLGVPAAAPAGSGGYRFLQTLGNGRPVTFDPCLPIHYSVRRSGEPEFGEAVVTRGIDAVSQATGLRFVRDPDSTEAPVEHRDAIRQTSRGPLWKPVLIAWSGPTELPVLAGAVAGIGGPGGSFGSAPASRHYMSGIVVFDTADLVALAANPQTRFEVQATVLHELGHLVGLDHVDDRTEVMFPAASTTLTGYADGDLRGLHALGSGPCSAKQPGPTKTSRRRPAAATAGCPGSLEAGAGADKHGCGRRDRRQLPHGIRIRGSGSKTAAFGSVAAGRRRTPTCHRATYSRSTALANGTLVLRHQL